MGHDQLLNFDVKLIRIDGFSPIFFLSLFLLFFCFVEGFFFEIEKIGARMNLTGAGPC